MERPGEYLPRVPALWPPSPIADYNVGFYQPQPGVQPTGNQVVVMVMQAQPTDVPGQMMCPHCQTVIVTQIGYRNGKYTWMVFGLLAAFMCWFCCCIPFCVDSCKDVAHSCPHCLNVLHIHKRMT
ncbi:LITAF domain-containing protein-like [Cebidichthys violaceus]|uniref:LITAF domain-containing protein-like n=1 Tax=Cebidichthys violaceus TaxID=271503 RepID=UPI0035CB16D6